jgi:Gluconate 2-dehydrogenase subunit 3
MTPIGRRGILKIFGTVPLAAGAALTEAQAQTAHQGARREGKAAAAKGKAFAPQFFNPHEWATVRLLVDILIPRDERSGSATDAGVPEFMDYMLRDPLATQRELEERQTAMRGGLAWLDLECQDRVDKTFLDCSEADRKAVLDDIAYPEKAKKRPELSQGVAFFSNLRDFTASGFWSSKMGVEDLQYIGNTYVAEWKGCPPEVLKKLGLEDA